MFVLLLVSEKQVIVYLLFRPLRAGILIFVSLPWRTTTSHLSSCRLETFVTLEVSTVQHFPAEILQIRPPHSTHTHNTTTDRCLCLQRTRAVCAALSTCSWQRECWGRRSVIKRGSRQLTSVLWRDRLHSRDNLFITLAQSATDWYETTTLTFTTHTVVLRTPQQVIANWIITPLTQ